jgi:hypothetical protein
MDAKELAGRVRAALPALAFPAARTAPPLTAQYRRPPVPRPLQAFFDNLDLNRGEAATALPAF